MERPDFHGLAERLRQDYGAQKIWLYGSYARGTATEDSDVDLLVISPTTESLVLTPDYSLDPGVPPGPALCGESGRGESGRVRV